MLDLFYYMFNSFMETVKKWKKSVISIICIFSFIWVVYHIFFDIKRKILLREGLKCDKRLPHLIPEVNNSDGIKMKENSWFNN